MRVVITGGSGFIGRKLAERLLRVGRIAGSEGRSESFDELVLFDQAAPTPPMHADRRLKIVTGDIADRSAVEAVITAKTTTVFHLAAVVSAAAEADLDLGLRINLDGTRLVLDACRRLPAPPRVIFASSLAVFGGDPPLVVDDLTPPAPRTSYGAQKTCGELLVNDYSRRGLIDGRALRLPTIVVRPGRPNKAASTFASSILREPLAGQTAVCPVTPSSMMAILSPRRLIDCIVRVHDLDGELLGLNRTILLPAIGVTIAEIVAGLKRAQGQQAVDRITWEHDPRIQKIVDGWPARVEATRAAALGLEADRNIDEIIQAFIEDDLAAQKALVSH